MHERGGKKNPYLAVLTHSWKRSEKEILWQGASRKKNWNHTQRERNSHFPTCFPPNYTTQAYEEFVLDCTSIAMRSQTATSCCCCCSSSSSAVTLVAWGIWTESVLVSPLPSPPPPPSPCHPRGRNVIFHALHLPSDPKKPTQFPPPSSSPDVGNKEALSRINLISWKEERKEKCGNFFQPYSFLFWRSRLFVPFIIKKCGKSQHHVWK